MSILSIPETTLSEISKPLAGYHFAVVFFSQGLVASPLDMRFKKVGGLASEIETFPYKEGGENLYTHRLPSRVSYNNLVLERGMVIAATPLVTEFNTAMSNMKFSPGNVLVALLDDDSIPEAAWLFLKTYPVKWSVSELAADVNGLAIETMELAYSRFQVMRV